MELTSYELLNGRASPHLDFLRTFGEIAMIHDAKQIQGKLKNKGKPSVFVGYAMEVYAFLTIDNQSLILSSNYIWLNQSYEEYMNLETTIFPKTNLVRNDEEEQWELDLDIDTETNHEEEAETQDQIENDNDNDNSDEDSVGSDQSNIRTESIRGVN